MKRGNRQGQIILSRVSFFKYGLLAPSFLYLFFFFAYPLFKLFLISCFVDGNFTVNSYLQMYQKSVYLKVILLTFRLSIIVTFFSLILAYPLAYFLNRAESTKMRDTLMICIVLPFCTSVLVRTYAWMVILGRHGIINSTLLKLNLVSAPLDLLYNTFSVTIGMVHVLLPFMFFPIYTVMVGIDKDLVLAAQNLGASPFQAFIKVFFPLSIPGVGAGSLMVFILALGFFVTPALLGGRMNTMISMLIENQVTVQLDWPFASAIAFVLLILTLIIFNISNQLLGIDRIWGRKL